MSRVLPILFNTDMVRAILDGRKTVTRRVMKWNKKPIGYYDRIFWKMVDELNGKSGTWAGFYKDSDIFYIDGEKHVDAVYYKPPYQVDDIMYVRETWQCLNPYSDKEYAYRASCDTDYAKDIGKWLPSIHMPKEAARIWLKVTDVRVERLKDITEEQAYKEGVTKVHDNSFNRDYWHYKDEQTYLSGNVWTESARQCFLWGIWNGTLKKADYEKYCWNINPWVWVIEFERCEKLGNQH